MRYFKSKTSIQVPYLWQGYIYFHSRLFKDLPQFERDRIRHVCKLAGGAKHRALFEYVTTDASPQQIAMKYYISEPTLFRMAVTYTEEFYKEMTKNDSR